VHGRRILGVKVTIRTFSIAVLLFSLSGCGRTPKSSGGTDSLLPLDETKVVGIARKALDDRTGSSKNATFQPRRDGSEWSVWVWWEPRTPGGHALITIDQNGKVTEYLQGH
jgi:hypothetical protein